MSYRYPIVWAGVLAAAMGGAAATVQSEPVSPPRERGVARFASPCPALQFPGAIPLCVQAPATDAPTRDPSVPVLGVFAEDDAGLSACFDPDVPPPYEVQLAVARAMHPSGPTVDRFDLAGSWPGFDNAPITLTWSFVPDGLNVPPGGGINDPAGPSELFANLDAKFGGDRAQWIAQFEAVFARWSQLSGVRYQRVTFGGTPWDDGASWGTAGATGLRGDVRISMHPIDGSFGIIAYNSYPSGGDMVLDSAENWGSLSNSYRYLRNTVGHEHGHGLGLAHVCPRNNTKLMEPFLSVLFDGPQQDEIRGVQRSYGDPYEPNGDADTPTPLGVISAGMTLTPSAVPPPAVADAAITSLAINDDVDRFSITTGAAPVLITTTVAPVGTLYADYVQDSGCNTTTPVTDAARFGNLRVQLFSASGTQIRDANAASFGGTETITDFLASPSTTYTIRVSETQTLTETQLYSLSITASTPVFAATDGTLADRVRLTWNTIPTATLYTLFRGSTPARNLAMQIGTGSTSATSFDDVTAAAGTTYYYWLEATITGITGSRPAAGPDAGFRASAPSNDACAAAATLTPGPALPFSTALATTDGPVESSCGQGNGWNIAADIWYAVLAPVPGRYIVQTCGSGFDTRLAMYATCPSFTNTALACNDDSAACSGSGSSLAFMAETGQTFRLRVGGPAGGVGSGQIQLFCPGDFNRSGDTSVQDVFDLLAAFFSGSSAADVNMSGSVSIQDLFDYLAWYLGGCG